MKGPVFVVLAAGMGSRGEALLGYSVYDALCFGFEKVIFIIRHDIEQDFRELVLSRMGTRIKYELVFQDLDTLILPEVYAEARRIKRAKLWETSRVLLRMGDKIDVPFAVINGDDFYSKEAFAVLGVCLVSAELSKGVIAPYGLDKSLCPQGAVARGVYPASLWR